MAIIGQGVGFTTSKVVDGFMLLSQDGKSTTMHKANNNRSNVKAQVQPGVVNQNNNFVDLDLLITTLDAQFDTLPNQSDWNDYAANIAGNWQLCANCAPESSGKKLFRQYNYSRIIAKLPLITVPTDNTAYAASLVTGIIWDINYPAQPDRMLVSILPPGIRQRMTYQVGRLNSNPTYFWQGTESGFHTSGSSFYAFFSTLYLAVTSLPPLHSSKSIQVPGCVADEHGAPGLKTTTAITVQNDI